MASPNWDSVYVSFENAILNGITSLVSAFSYLSSSKLDVRELEKIKKKVNSAFEEVNSANKKAKAQGEELISQIEKLNTEKEGMEHAKRLKEKEHDKLSKRLEYYENDEQKKTEKKNTLEDEVEAAKDTYNEKRLQHTILKHVYLVFLFLYILFALMEMLQMPFKEIFGKLHSITIFITGIIWYFLNDTENKLLVSREVMYEHSITVNCLEKALSKLEKKKKETEEKLQGIEIEIENVPNISVRERKIHDLNEEKERTTKYEKYLFILAEELELPEENYSYRFLRASLGRFCASWERKLPWVQEGKEEVSNIPVRKNIRDQLKYLDDALKLNNQDF